MRGARKSRKRLHVPCSPRPPRFRLSAGLRLFDRRPVGGGPDRGCRTRGPIGRDRGHGLRLRAADRTSPRLHQRGHRRTDPPAARGLHRRTAERRARRGRRRCGRQDRGAEHQYPGPGLGLYPDPDRWPSSEYGRQRDAERVRRDLDWLPATRVFNRADRGGARAGLDPVWLRRHRRGGQHHHQEGRRRLVGQRLGQCHAAERRRLRQPVWRRRLCQRPGRSGPAGAGGARQLSDPRTVILDV